MGFKKNVYNTYTKNAKFELQLELTSAATLKKKYGNIKSLTITLIIH